MVASDLAPVVAATGFWRLERPPQMRRTWLIGPDGHAVFLLGVNTVMRDTLIENVGVPRCAGIRGYIRRHEPGIAAQVEWARLSTGSCAGQTVPKPYGFNSVGAFSETNDFDATGGDSYMIRPQTAGGAGAPYAVAINVKARGPDRALKDEHGTPLRGGFTEFLVGDPFNPLFLSDLDDMVADSVAPRRADPQLQMWFAGNEIGIFDIAGHGGAGVRDFRRWIWSDVPAGSTIDRPACARHELARFLRDIHQGSISALNAAWDSAYPDFSAIVDVGPRPVPYVHDCNARAGEDLQRFVHDRLLREWVRAVTSRIRAADPNHLIASPRLAVTDPRLYRFWSGPGQPNPDHWADEPTQTIGNDTPTVRYSPFDLLRRDGQAGFDLVAINVYTGATQFSRPWFTDGLHKIQSDSGLPIIISEFGIRARIEGWSNKGGAPAFVPHTTLLEDQRKRGQRYQSQIDQLIGFRDVVGAMWHAWSDRFNATQTSTQINLGIVQCTDPDDHMQAGRRWTQIDALIAETNHDIIKRIADTTGP
jgi:hypothetical protein